jgi:probable phosphoglycerate mutase
MSGELVIVRHSDTEWSGNGRHTSYTDLPLTDLGIERAATLAPRLADCTFAAVWSSPRRRALETARIAGFEPLVREDLREWEYGEYEGLTTEQIRELRPGWDIWRDGCPGGEDAAATGARADEVLAVLPPEGDVLVFSHGHFSRVLTARRLGLDATQGALFVLKPTEIGVLSHEHGRHVLRSLG